MYGRGRLVSDKQILKTEVMALLYVVYKRIYNIFFSLEQEEALRTICKIFDEFTRFSSVFDKYKLAEYRIGKKTD